MSLAVGESPGTRVGRFVGSGWKLTADSGKPPSPCNPLRPINV